MKKLLLTLSLALITLGIRAQESTQFYYDGFLYQPIPGINAVQLNGASAGSTFSTLDIPETVENEGVTYTVSRIGSAAFAYTSRLKTVNIPKTIVLIGEGAFSGSAVETVTFADGSRLRQIGDRGFNNCVWLTSFNMPSSVESIGAKAFYDCSRLENCDVPMTATLGIDAFENCTSLTPDEYGVRYAGPYLVEASDKEASTILIRPGTKYIEERAFYNCQNLTTMIIPEGVSTIETTDLFAACKSLTSVTLPSNLTAIGDEMFAGCYSLQGIDLSHVKSIGRNAFSGCTSLTSLDMPSVTSLGNGAFRGCIGLTEPIFPAGVSELPSFLYQDCTGITSITIPSHVTKLGGNSFEGCTGLTEITIPATVTEMPGTFTNCTGLTVANVQSSGSISSTFKGCTSLDILDVSDLAAFCNTRVSLNSNYKAEGPLQFAKHLYWNGVEVRDLVVPDGVTSISDYLFLGYEPLISLTLPEGLTAIGKSAFEECTSLATVKLPSTLTTIDNYAFRGDSKLYEVYNLSSLELTPGSTNGGYVAYYAKVIHTSADEPSIFFAEGKFKFYNDGTQYILFDYDRSQTDLVLPETCNGSPYVLAADLFQRTYSTASTSTLKSIVLPACMTSIPAKAFEYCISLESVTFPAGLKEIGESAFDNCTSLTRIDLPEGLETLGRYAFRSCM